MKTLNDYFCDWESGALGFGYGSGEEHVIPALRSFLEAIPTEGGYDHEKLAERVGAVPAWLLINLLCHQSMIEYGTSPRYGWLTETGKRLRDYMLSKDVAGLLETLSYDQDQVLCYRDHCNCDGPHCRNPFWLEGAPLPTSAELQDDAKRSEREATADLSDTQHILGKEGK